MSSPHVVYFIQAGNRGPVKIGITTNVRARLKTLSAASPVPLTLIAAIPGGRTEELWLHERFASGRMHGEWFRFDTTGLADFIAAVLRDENPDPRPHRGSDDDFPCVACGWPVQPELQDRDIRTCWTCQREAVQQ